VKYTLRLTKVLNLFDRKNDGVMPKRNPSLQATVQDRILGRNQGKVFLLAIHGHLYSFALRFLFLQTHATSSSFWRSVTVHCKGERRKT
jgi:hypothetical protein